MSTPNDTKLSTLKVEDMLPNIVKMADNVYVAVNFAESTVGMIVSDESIILIDTGPSPDSSKEILAEFRKITDKPIAAIIYTHGHPDHIMGIVGLLPNGNNDDQKIQIWSRDNLNSENKLFEDLGPIFAKRIGRQFGKMLPLEKQGTGMAPVRKPAVNPTPPVFIPPTHTFSEDKKVLTFGNVTLELNAAQGETNDQLFVWYKDKEVLFCGDNIYRSFPNLYAIRGAGYRDIKIWANSIKQMLDLKPKSLVMGHTMPATTQEETLDIMQNYHDAVRYVYDKSVEGMNKGLNADELALYVKLPEHLAQKPYLKEIYGNVEWAVRSVYCGHFGWFDDNSRKLMPLTPKEEAERMASAMGGKDSLLQKAQDALAAKDYKWAALLADYCIELAMPAQLIKAESLEALAETQTSSTGRNYMRSQALELRASQQ